mmetsp:Transcript_2102/g.4814  ORF Transcript_2102/g.4814 Transcript_2102/m.4814 type:complete len:229 (-) Transcript_2102:1034-1720(-)
MLTLTDILPIKRAKLLVKLKAVFSEQVGRNNLKRAEKVRIHILDRVYLALRRVCKHIALNNLDVILMESVSARHDAVLIERLASRVLTFLIQEVILLFLASILSANRLGNVNLLGRLRELPWRPLNILSSRRLFRRALLGLTECFAVGLLLFLIHINDCSCLLTGITFVRNAHTRDTVRSQEGDGIHILLRPGEVALDIVKANFVVKHFQNASVHLVLHAQVVVKASL